MNKRNHYSAEFKTKVVLEILSEESTINQIAAQYGISPVVLSRWKKEFLERASEVFKKGPSDAEKNSQTARSILQNWSAKSANSAMKWTG